MTVGVPLLPRRAEFLRQGGGRPERWRPCADAAYAQAAEVVAGMGIPPEIADAAPERAESDGRRSSPRLATIKKRRDFLAARKGARWAGPRFVVEAVQRAGDAAGGPARFGFTVSGQVGGAVERNRIKRRLRAAVRDVLAATARPAFDYVLIARRPALRAEFADLVADLRKGLAQVHAGGQQRRGRHEGQRPKKQSSNPPRPQG